MKRKLGVTLLIIATTLAGTPEAVKQFQDLNAAVRHWASNSLGGNFLVYAAGANERALPDRYDYHQIAPHPAAAPAEWSYGLTADLSPVAAPRAHAVACPSQRQPVVAQTDSLAHARVNVAPQPRAQTARRTRETEAPARARLTDERLARELERAVTIVGHALGAKLRAQGLSDEARGQEAEAKLKGLRLKTVEMLKARRGVPVKIARLDDARTSLGNQLAELSLLPAPVVFRLDREAQSPVPAAAAHAKRNCVSKAGKAPRPAQSATCANATRETEVSPFVVTTAINAGSDGFNADNN